MCFTSPELRSASSYGLTKFCIGNTAANPRPQQYFRTNSYFWKVSEAASIIFISNLISSIFWSGQIWKMLNFWHLQEFWSQCKIYWTCKSKVAAVFSKKLILLKGLRGWEYQNRIQLDLLYLLVGSNLKRLSLVDGCWSLVVGCWLLVVGKLRIQGRMQIFENMSQKGLNHDPRPELESRGKMLQIPLKIVDLGAFCVELWSLQKKNFGPNVIYYVFISDQ